MRLLRWLGLLQRLFPAGNRQTRARRYRDRYAPVLHVTRLEPRRVLNAAPIPLPVAPPPSPATHAPSGATNPNVMVVAAADTLNQTTHSSPSAQNTVAVRILREGTNLEIDGGTAQSVSLALGQAGSGTITIDGAQMAFSGVQSIIDSLHATNLTISLADGSASAGQTWTLNDAQRVGSFVLQSSNGMQMTLAQPTGALTIDTRAAGANPGDTLQIGNLDLRAGSDLTVLGRGNDTINVTGNVQLGAGPLTVSVGTESISGTIYSSGGSVNVTATSAVTLSASALIRDAGGTIVIDAGPAGTLLDSGVIDASSTATGTSVNATGGSVDLLGQNVGLMGDAVVDVSGSTGGGAVRIGGDFRGANAAIENSAYTYVGANVTIAADAGNTGSGGTIVLWSNEATMFYGQIEARGGSAGGDGGTVEISSAGNLAEQGLVDLNAPQGHVGSLLLDPLTITIQHSTSALTDDTNLSSILFGSAGVSFTISDFSLSAAAGNVTLEAFQSITADSGVVVTMTGNHNLVIETKNDTGHTGAIDLSNGSFSITGNGSITIVGSTDGGAVGNVTVGALSVASGNISVGTGNGTVTVAGAVNASGTVRIQSDGDVTQSGTITASALGVATTAGNITLAGNNSVGTFAASDGVLAGVVTFNNSAAFAIGSVTADASIGFAAAKGIATDNGNISLASTAAIQVNKDVDAGTGTVRFQAAGAVTGSGNITATALGVATTTGNITLTGSNSVGTLAANDGDAAGVITFNDAAALTLGNVMADANIGFAAATGITSNNQNVSLASTSTVQVNQAISAGTGTVRVQAAGAVTGSGNITAAALGVATTSGSITLTGSSSVGTFAASDSAATGAITFNDATALILGNVTADVNIGFAATSGITTTNGNVSLAANGSLLGNQAIAAGTGTVRLQAAGDVSQSGKITAAALGVATTTGNISLTGSNKVGTLAAGDTASAGSFIFTDSAALALGNVTADANISFAATSGIATNNGNVSLSSTSTMQVNQAIGAGTGTVRLQAAGAVSGSGVATAAALGVATTSGNITLTGANSVGTLAASDTSSTRVITFTDAAALTIGSVTADANIGFAATSGIATNNGNVSLSSTSTVQVNQAIAAGTETVRIQAAGDVTGSAAITATALGAATTAGNISLTGSNSVGTLAAGDTASAGSVTFNDAAALALGNVTADANISFTATSGIVTNNGNVSLASTSTVQVNQSIAAGTGTIRLQGAGDVTGTGAVTAAAFGVATSTGNISFTGNNSVGTFAADDTASSGTITLKDATGLTIGSVAADANISFAATAGISTSNGNVSLGSTAGTVQVNQAIAAGTGTVRFQAAGDVTGAGAITAAALGAATTSGNITLTGSNSVGTFAGSDTASTGAITFNDAAALIIGSVTADANISFAATNGISTANGNASLGSTGTVQVNQAVAVGTGTVRLQAAGDVAASGAITATALGVATTAGNITLTTSNNVGTFAANDTASAGTITLKDTAALAIGSVTADANIGFIAISGVAANNGNVSLSSTTGSVTVNQAVGAGTGTVRVQAAGAVTGTGAIGASSLGVATSTGSMTLTGSNSVGTLAASDTAASGAITFNDGAALTIGSVAADANISFAATSGITTNNGNVSLGSTGTVTIGQAISAGTGVSGGTIRIQAGGDVTQSATISSLALGVATSAGNITLGGNNNVGTFAAGDTNAGGTITLVDAAALTIGSVTADANVGFAATTGISANNGNVALNVTGNLTVSQSVAAGSATARLVSSNNIVWTNGTVQSQDLLLEAANGVGAAGAAVAVNVSGQLAAESTGVAATGGIFVSQVAAGGDLTIGSVTDLLSNPVAGVITTNNGAIDVETKQGNLVVNANVLSTNALGDGLGSVTLVADSNGAAGAFTLTIGPSVHVRSGNLTSGAVTLQGNDLSIDPTAEIHATGIGGGVQLFTSTPTVAMSIGPTADVAGAYSVIDAAFARIIDADVVTIGKSAVQSGDITFYTAAVPADQQDNVVGVPVFPDLVVNQTGAGRIVLNDENSAVALNAGTGNITLNAGSGGIVATNGANAFAELQTSGPLVTLNTTGPIGTLANPIQLADVTNPLLQVVGIGTLLSAEPASSVFLSGLGTLTLGTVALNGADLSVTAAGDLNSGIVGTLGGNIRLAAAGNVSVTTSVNSGAGTLTLQGDSDGNGIGNLTIAPAATVQTANPTSNAITLQGADLAIGNSPLTSLVTATAAGGGIVIQSSAPGRPINVGGPVGAVAGINLTDFELTEIVTTASGMITIGDVSQVGNITFTTAHPTTTPGASVAVLQSTAGAGAIILDNSQAGGPPVALDAGSGQISLTAGTGGVVEAPAALSSRADIATTGPSVTINTAGPIGSPANPIRFADNSNPAHQVIDIGTSIPAGQPVFLSGMGTLTLGSITLADADFDVNATAINLLSNIQTAGGNLTFQNTTPATPAAVRLFGINPTLGTGRAGGDSGSIDLSNASVSSNSAGQSLTIDATSAAGFNGGNITLGNFTAAQILKNLTARTNVVNATTTTTITIASAVNVTGTITLTGQSVVVNGPVNGGPPAVLETVAITADNVAINNNVFAAISPAGGNITIQNATAGRPIDLGTGVLPTSLNLSSSALAFLHAGLVHIGRNDALASGSINVSANIAPAGAGALHLFTGGDVGGPGGIAAANLAISSGGSVSLTGNNAVGTLAGTVAGPSFTFNQAGAISIGTVDGVVGINAGAGNATFTSTGGFTQTAPITAGLLTIKTLNDAGVPITVAGSANNVTMVDLESLNSLGSAPAGGAVSYTATNNVLIEKLVTAATATLTSANGSILNGNPADPNEISAGLLQLSAVNGSIGSPAGQLLTNVGTVNAVAGNGGVHLANNSSLVIVPAGPPPGSSNGITAAGGGIDVSANGNLTLVGSVALNGSGEISLLAQDRMIIGNSITNAGGGNIVLQSMSTADGDVNILAAGSIFTAGNITIAAGHDFLASPLGLLTAVVQTTSGNVSISAGDAANIVQPKGGLSPIPPIAGFSIQTGTGVTAAAPPFFSATPQFVSPGVAISVDGTVTLVVTFGRAVEQDFTVTVNWGDGKTDTFASMTAGTHVFTHTFSLAAIQSNTFGALTSQLGGTTAFSPIISVQGDPRVQFFLAGVSNSISHQTLLLIAPGLGLVGTELRLFGSPAFGFFAAPEVRVAVEGAAPALPPGASSFETNQSSPSGATAAAADRLLLRTVSTDGAGKDDRADDIDIGEDPNINIRELTTESLKDLFAKLPDGRYRIVWYRGAAMGSATERVILDVLLREGKPINFDDLEKPAVPLKKLDAEGAKPQVLKEPAAAPAEAEVPTGALNESRTNDETHTTDSTNMTSYSSHKSYKSHESPAPATTEPAAAEPTDFTMAAGAVVPAAALVEMALLRRKNVQQAPVAAKSSPPKNLTHAARLYRRLRRGEQPLTADVD